MLHKESLVDELRNHGSGKFTPHFWANRSLTLVKSKINSRLWRRLHPRKHILCISHYARLQELLLRDAVNVDPKIEKHF